MRPTPLALVLVAVLGLSACSAKSRVAAPATTSPTTVPTTARPEPVDPLSPAPAVEPPAPTGSQPPCTRLTVTDADLLADDTQLQEVFAIRTTGSPCALRGWPVVSLLGANGTPLAVSSSQVGAARTVTLSRDTSLSFVLSTPRSQDCADVSSVEVRLPGANGAIRTTSTMQVCDGTLTVSPVQRTQDVEGGAH